MSTPTIHDVDNYGRHSVMPGRHTVADLASRALAQTLTRVETACSPSKVCELKADGYADFTLGKALVANGQAADIYDAAWIVGAATGAFCPEVSA